MKLVIQRVKNAGVNVDGEEVAGIKHGLMILLGIEVGDAAEQATQLASKLLKIRLWPDRANPDKAWASSVKDNDFELLIVSQFTLFASFKKPKPDYHQAMGGDKAEELYETFVQACRDGYKSSKVATGRFGAMMDVTLTNDGPVTVELISKPCIEAEKDEVKGQKVVDPAPVKSCAPDVAEMPKVSSASGRKVENSSVSSHLYDGLEEILAHQPYLGGFTPSRVDGQTFAKIGNQGVPLPSSPNIQRWFKHIYSFPECIRAQWAAKDTS